LAKARGDLVIGRVVFIPHWMPRLTSGFQQSKDGS
jgi:hypothetical protein